MTYVNSRFASHLGGRRKRKKPDSIKTEMSPTFTNPQQSRCVASTPNSPQPSSVIPNSSQICLAKNYSPSTSRAHGNTSALSVANTNVYPSLPIQTSSISYHVLLPHGIYWSEDDSDVVLVVGANSHGFDKSITQYLEDLILHSHSREQEGSIKYQFN